MNLHLQRALVLLEQSRSDLAEKELRLALAEAPNDALVHALLAQCLCERQELLEATDEAQTAVGLDPELADAHHILARILLQRNRPREALAAINEALRLQPHWASHYAALASIYLAERDWPAAIGDHTHSGFQLICLMVDRVKRLAWPGLADDDFTAVELR